MELVLEVVGPERHSLGANASHRFLPAGGVIGRSTDCDWVIPDSSRHLSGRHAIVSYEAGQYFITDISTNGIFLNGSDALAKNVAMVLHDDDRLVMGDIQFRARLFMEFSQVAPALAAQPQVLAEPLPELPLALENEPSLGDIAAAAGWLDVVDMDAEPEPPAAPEEAVPVIAGQPVPAVPAVVAEQQHDDMPLSEPGFQPVVFAGPASSAAVSAFAAGLGLPPDAIESAGADAFMQRAGALLRLCLQGFLETAHARASLKNDFRLDMTLVNSRNNNPVKLSANVDQLLQHLLVGRQESFLSLEKGVQECVEDFQQHQQAMVAGMQNAFMELLQDLSPAELERRFERNKSGLQLSGKAARYWQAYRELHQDLLQEENLFDDHFVEPFARAYDEQIAQLKQSPGRR